MRAILLRSGNSADIYILDDNGKNIIVDFFENKLIKNQYGEIRAGFYRFINLIREYGYDNLTPEQFKCWKNKKKKPICELRKGSFRILCFKYDGGKKLLLVKHIVKKRDKEEKEYYNINEF